MTHLKNNKKHYRQFRSPFTPFVCGIDQEDQEYLRNKTQVPVQKVDKSLGKSCTRQHATASGYNSSQGYNQDKSKGVPTLPDHHYKYYCPLSGRLVCQTSCIDCVLAGQCPREVLESFAKQHNPFLRGNTILDRF